MFIYSMICSEASPRIVAGNLRVLFGYCILVTGMGLGRKVCPQFSEEKVTLPPSRGQWESNPGQFLLHAAAPTESNDLEYLGVAGGVNEGREHQ